jgi:glycosyltransferase involved in cell wall biosynthesis
MKKVLIITYYWPPGSGAGVQRWLKFTKYLPLNGWEPVVLTVDPRFASYPAIDRSLENDIPSTLRVFRTKALDYFRFYKKNKSEIPSAGFALNNDKSLTGKLSRFIRGNFFIPDPRRGWNRHAFRKACEIIENESIVNIITTSPPHSTQLIGLRLKKKYPGVRWIADLRDPWTEIYYYHEFYPTIISRWIDLQYEKETLKHADKIITVGYTLKDMFAARLPRAENKTEVIFNGYDEQDFKGLATRKPAIFTISYIGTLSPSYPLAGFLKALSDLSTQGTDFRLKFTGIVSEEQRNLILAHIGESRTEFIGYANHHNAILNMVNSSALLLIIPDHKSNKCIITGKLFEYLATKVPVVCLGPKDGDAAKILGDCGNGKIFSYEDSAGILEYLRLLISGTSPGILKSPEKFRRDRLTQRIVSLLKG